MEGHEGIRFGVGRVRTRNTPSSSSSAAKGGDEKEKAVGRGSRPKAGMVGYTVSNLRIPGFVQDWEVSEGEREEEGYGKPGHIASALDIMLEAPLGASAFNNEFGRPGVVGYRRTFEQRVPAPTAPTPSSSSTEVTKEKTEVRGYHKPIMIAGGYGTVTPHFSTKQPIQPGSKLIVLGASSADLNFASVQRDNAEMETRCQQVIDACTSLGLEGPDLNPIESIHDVGAGGLSNALPELVHDSGLGAVFDIRDESDGVWRNESQERYVLAVSKERLEVFEGICRRERASFCIVGEAVDAVLQVRDDQVGLVTKVFVNAGFPSTSIHVIGRVTNFRRILSTLG
ncbi:hypothetical protein MD484_g966, partial [Candolleomyces efflorescens]